MSDPVLEALNRVPLEVTAADIDEIVAYLRKAQAQHARGEKPKKEGAEMDLVEVLGIKPQTGKINRRA